MFILKIKKKSSAKYTNMCMRYFIKFNADGAILDDLKVSRGFPGIPVSLVL